MDELSPYARLRNPSVSLLITLGVVIIGFVLIGPFIGLLAAYPFYNGTPLEFADALNNVGTDPAFKVPFLIAQGVGSAFALIAIPIFVLQKQGRSFFQFVRQPFYIQAALIVPMIVVVFMGINSVFIKWNADLTLPDAFKSIEDVMRNLEDKAAQITQFLTTYDNNAQLILAFVVIAIIPAVGEELVFRGMIQNDLLRLTRNPHIAIWVAAVIFSFIHFQFFGFLPRVLLGALFGYLYLWSGNLVMAMIAHFVNNAFTLITLYLYGKGAINVNIEDPSVIPWQAVIFSGIFTALLLFAYKIFFDKKPKAALIE